MDLNIKEGFFDKTLLFKSFEFSNSFLLWGFLFLGFLALDLASLCVEEFRHIVCKSPKLLS